MRINTKCSIAVHCLLCVHEFGERKKVTSELLALSTGCNPVVIRGIVSALKKDGILASRPGGARLACPPGEVSLYRICIALEPGALGKLMGVHPFPSALCPVGQRIHPVLDGAYEKIRGDMRESLRSVTLADIIERYRAETPGQS